MEQETLALILAKLNQMDNKIDIKFESLNVKIDNVNKTLNDKIDNVFNVLPNAFKQNAITAKTSIPTANHFAFFTAFS